MLSTLTECHTGFLSHSQKIINFRTLCKFFNLMRECDSGAKVAILNEKCEHEWNHDRQC